MRRCHATNPLSWSVMKKGKFTITFIASGLIEERLRSVQRANPPSNLKLLNACKNRTSLGKCVSSLQYPSSHAAQMKYIYHLHPEIRNASRGKIIIFNWKKDCWTAINIQDKASAPSSPSGRGGGTPESHDGKD